MDETLKPRFFGNCRVLGLIDEGPLVRTYRAEQQPSGRIVTVKALRETIVPASSPADELEREAKLLARFHHPNVRALYDFVKLPDAMWLVLEDVPGVTLAELLASGGKLAPAAAVSIAHDLAEALAHVHARGVVHRDLRPSSVRLTPEGEIKLSGFHVAHAARLPSAPEVIESAGSFSSPAYMSPEQVLGESVDSRADLFAVGVLLYEMLAGVRPFDGPDAREVTQRIRHESPDPLVTSARGVTDPLARIVERCLEKVPDHRFSTAAELARELSRVAEAGHLAYGPRAVSSELLRAGLIETLPTAGEDIDDGRPSLTPAPRASLARTAVGLSLVLAAMVAGGAVIQSRSPDRASSLGVTDGLPLLPPRPAELRVVARPWASVYVDGYFLDVTPFARPIPLPAGTHQIVFRHPSAPEEQRTVKVAENERAFVEVEMKVPDVPLSPPRPSAPPRSTTPLRRSACDLLGRADRKWKLQGHGPERPGAELVDEDICGLVEIDDAAAAEAPALPPDGLEQALRIVGELDELVTRPQVVRIALREELRREEGHDGEVDGAVRDGAAQREQERRIVIAELRPEDTGIVEEDHPGREHHLLLRLGHGGLVPDVGDVATQERVEEGRFSDVGDAHDEAAHGPLDGPRATGCERLAGGQDLRPGLSLAIVAERQRDDLGAAVLERACTLVETEPERGRGGIGEVALGQELEARLVPSQLRDHRVRAGAGHPRVEDL